MGYGEAGRIGAWRADSGYSTAYAVDDSFGQAEIAVAAGSEVAKLVGGLFGGGSGTVDPARKQILDSYYSAAVNGDATGVANLQKWLADVPPHPTASNTYAQSLLAKLGNMAGKGGVGGTGPGLVGKGPVPGSLAAMGLGGSDGTIAGIPITLIMVGALVYVLARKK